MKGTFCASMAPCLLVALARHGQVMAFTQNTAFREGAPPDKSAFGFEALNSACVLAPAWTRARRNESGAGQDWHRLQEASLLRSRRHPWACARWNDNTTEAENTAFGETRSTYFN